MVETWSGLFRENGITPGRRGKPRFAGGNGRFTDQSFAPVKVGFLFADVNNDPRLPDAPSSFHQPAGVARG